jgi:hypothetical protein
MYLVLLINLLFAHFLSTKDCAFGASATCDGSSSHCMQAWGTVVFETCLGQLHLKGLGLSLHISDAAGNDVIRCAW